MSDKTLEISPDEIVHRPPTFAQKPYYESDIYSELGEANLRNYALWGMIGIGVLTGALKNPRQVLTLIREVANDPKGFLDKFRESTPQVEFPEHLDLQKYGHLDVIDRFDGKIPKIDSNPNSDSRKLCIIALGGGQGGNIGAGILRGMQESGAYQRADGIIMVSAGIPNVMYTEAEQNAEGVKVYQDDNTQEGFFVKIPPNKKDAVISIIHHLNHTPVEPLVDTTTVADGMRNRRPLRVEKIRDSEKELIAVVMDASTGEPKYIDLKKAKDPITVEDAGICLPAISQVPSVELEDGRRYVDGGTADPIPLKWAFDHGYTDVIILANSPVIKNNGLFARTFQSLILERLTRNPNYGYGEPVVKALRNYQNNLSRAASNVNQIIREDNPNRRVAIIEPYDSVMSGLLETNRDRLITAYNDAADFARHTFNGHF